MKKPSKWYNDFLDLPKQLPDAQWLHRTMRRTGYCTENDIREAAELGIPLEEVIEGKAAGLDPKVIKELYLKYGTELGGVLYSED